MAISAACVEGEDTHAYGEPSVCLTTDISNKTVNCCMTRQQIALCQLKHEQQWYRIRSLVRTGEGRKIDSGTNNIIPQPFSRNVTCC